MNIVAYVYITINMINGRMYIGKHKNDHLDGYIGSGLYISQAVEKYGYENFKCYMIKAFESELEAYDYEKYLIKKYDASNSRKFYNILEGGQGFSSTTRPFIVTNGIETVKILARDKDEYLSNGYSIVGYNKGKVHVTNGINNHYLFPEELNGFITENPDYHLGTTADYSNREASIKGRVALHKEGIPGYIYVYPDEVDELLSKGFIRGSASHVNRGYVWINDGTINIQVSPDRLPLYESNGFVRGMLPRIYHALKDDEDIQITVDEIDDYKSRGYKIDSGIATKRSKGYIRVTNGEVDKLIPPEQLPELADKGFYKGSRMTGKVKMTNGIVNEYVSPDDVSYKESEGFWLGFTSKKDLKKNRQLLNV